MRVRSSFSSTCFHKEIGDGDSIFLLLTLPRCCCVQFPPLTSSIGLSRDKGG
jgi:hypothetical protein